MMHLYQHVSHHHAFHRQQRQQSGKDATTSSIPEDGPWLHQLLPADNPLAFNSPAPRQRSLQLEKRIAQLQEEADNKRYAEMVADITQHERAAAAAKDSLLPSTRLQLSFGLHVIVTMGTFFALGYYGGNYVFGKQVWVSDSRITMCVQNRHEGAVHKAST